MNRATSLGPLELRSPLVAASGTVGSVYEWAEVADTQSLVILGIFALIPPAFNVETCGLPNGSDHNILK